MKFHSLSDLGRLSEGTPPPPREISKYGHNGKQATIRISLETTGRKGKSVTVFTGFHHNPETMRDVARILKELLGTGGTVKGFIIELQGDQKGRAETILTEMNYRVTK